MTRKIVGAVVVGILLLFAPLVVSEKQQTAYVPWDGKPVKITIDLAVDFPEAIAPTVRVDWGDKHKDEFEAKPGLTIKVKLEHIFYEPNLYEVIVTFHAGQNQVYRKVYILSIGQKLIAGR